MKMISKTHTSYIRCIKPNDKNTADYYNRGKVVEQLRYAGVLEAIRVSRAGYPIRMLHMDFYKKYKLLASHTSDCVTLCEALKCDNDQFKIGSTKVFLRRDEYYRIEGLRNKRFRALATKLSSTWRGYCVRKWYRGVVNSVIRIQSHIRCLIATTRVNRIRASRRLIMWWRTVWRLRLYKLATRIQVNYKAHYNRKRYLNLIKMIIRIQRFSRKYKRIRIVNVISETIEDEIVETEVPQVFEEVVEDIIKQKDERIDALELQMSTMSQNIELIMKNFNGGNNERVTKLEDELNSSRDTIREQEEIIRQDEEVKRNMGQKLYDVLLSLNSAKEEIERLRKTNQRLQRKKWFW